MATVTPLYQSCRVPCSLGNPNNSHTWIFSRFGLCGVGCACVCACVCVLQSTQPLLLYLLGRSLRLVLRARNELCSWPSSSGSRALERKPWQKDKKTDTRAWDSQRGSEITHSLGFRFKQRLRFWRSYERVESAGYKVNMWCTSKYLGLFWSIWGTLLKRHGRCMFVLYLHLQLVHLSVSNYKIVFVFSVYIFI